MANLATKERNAVFEYVKVLMGAGLVDFDLDPIHLETALDRALTRYRQRSSNAVEESYSFLELIPDVNEYRLADEIITVQSVFRRSIGARTGMGSGSNMSDPFSLAYTNAYMLSGASLTGIATYYMFSAYQSMVSTMFGGKIEFNWKPQTHILTILQRPYSQGEQILLKTYNYRPDFVLLTDIYAKQWLRDYTLATCKIILGEARSTFQSIAGPTGSISMNGDALKAAGKEEIEKLDKELDTQMAGGVGMTWITG